MGRLRLKIAGSFPNYSFWKIQTKSHYAQKNNKPVKEFTGLQCEAIGVFH